MKPQVSRSRGRVAKRLSMSRRNTPTNSAHLDSHNIRTAVVADGPNGVTRLEVLDLAADIEAVLGEWETNRP